MNKQDRQELLNRQALNFLLDYKDPKDGRCWADLSPSQTHHKNSPCFRVARVWSGSRKFERMIKNRKEAPALCPICNPNNGRATSYTELTPEEIKTLIG